MLNENKNASYSCHRKLQPTPNNTIVIENMIDMKEKESRYSSDATVKCSNKVKKKQQTKLEMMANTIIKDQQRKISERRLSDTLSTKIKARTQGRSRRWVIADVGATGHFMMQGAPVINVKPTTNPIRITLPDR